MRTSVSQAVRAAAPSMRAHVLLRPGELRLTEVERPSAGPEEVLLRVRAALTCGTDLKAFRRGHPKFPMPTLFGHEFSGELAEVGGRVRGFREGDAVMAVPTAPCGRCYYCSCGDENLCESLMDEYVVGGFGEYVKLPARVVRQNLFSKPGGLNFAEAALLEPLSCVMHGLEMVPLRPDDRVVLVGAGAVSLLHLLALRALGVEDVMVIGRGERRLGHTRALHPAAAVPGGIECAREMVFERTRGHGADVVIECTGKVSVWNGASSLARKGGWVVLFGGCPAGSRATFDTYRLHYDQVRVVSPFHFTARAVRRAHELLVSGTVMGRPLISGEYPLQDLVEALERHHRGDGIKYAVVP